MKSTLYQQLVSIAHERQTKSDPSHDVHHVIRVMNLAAIIAESVGADVEIVLPAACFHDVIVYPKNDPRSKHETDESAELAGGILSDLNGYPSAKIESVKTAIRQCSYSKGIVPDVLEARVLQDADRLEATGAISIMRTFSSGGQMNRAFYIAEDPFCEHREPRSYESSVDLFYQRLLRVEQGMHTDLARRIARRRTEYLHAFLFELKMELAESGVLTA